MTLALSWYGLFMHVCDSKHECSKRKNSSIKDHKLISCLWEYENIRSVRFYSL